MERRLVLSICITVISYSLNAQNFNSCKAELEKILLFQQKAWNEGNIEKYMSAYWNSDSLIFIGKSKTYGYASTLSNYKKSYPTPEKMGRLEFDDLQSECILNDRAYSSGKWILHYPNNEKIEGRFTLIWRKINNVWKIIYDHSS